RLFSGRISGPLACFSLLFFGGSLGCDKSTGPNKSPEGAPIASASSPSASETPAPPEEHREPSVEGRDFSTDPGGPQAATEGGVSPPRFSDDATPEFKRVFLDLDDWVKKNGGRVYGALVDLSTDKWLFRSAETEAINPAS